MILAIIGAAFGFAPITSTLYLALFLAFRILLSRLIVQRAEERELDNPQTWKILTLVFGIIAAAMFLIFNYRLGKRTNKKLIKQKAFKIIMVIVIAGMALAPFAHLELQYGEKREDERLNSGYYYSAIYHEDFIFKR